MTLKLTAELQSTYSSPRQLPLYPPASMFHPTSFYFHYIIYNQNRICDPILLKPVYHLCHILTRLTIAKSRQTIKNLRLYQTAYNNLYINPLLGINITYACIQPTHTAFLLCISLIGKVGCIQLQVECKLCSKQFYDLIAPVGGVTHNKRLPTDQLIYIVGQITKLTVLRIAVSLIQ